jgi:uncharacterized protein YjbI with pentapeptide repeats
LPEAEDRGVASSLISFERDPHARRRHLAFQKAKMLPRINLADCRDVDNTENFRKEHRPWTFLLTCDRKPYSSLFSRKLLMSTYEPLERFSHEDESLIDVLEKHKQWIEGKGGKRANLRCAALKNADMKGVNLMGADLREAVLERACLNNADLRGADLRKARLDRAGLIGTRLIAANLGFASLNEVVATEADFTEANLLQADLSKTVLIRAVLQHANLRQATLAEAKLVRADLRGADLTGADMGGAVLSGADLTGGDLCRTRLFRANLLGADLSRANLDGADLRESRLGDSRLIGSKLTRADLTGADLNGVCLDGADLSGWGVRRTACTRMLLSEAGGTVSFEPGEFEKTYLQRENHLEFSLPVPLGAATAYLAKFVTQSINAATGTLVVSLKGLEALSTYETKMLMVCFERGFQENESRIGGGRLKKAITDYFNSYPVRRDLVYLGEMLGDSAGGVIDFDSCTRIFDNPWQIKPVMIKEEILEEYRRVGRICEELHSLILSVLGAGSSQSLQPHGPDIT